ncbi:hypothetical protein CDN99_13650 [Roseateles aquatilis]|uniref:DUF2939 domain-containing protein n=1 Tax=Roseateles aquatilis TaxID=431061 RepID=A0A246JCM6_9BURK|nr:DUF2939 domain-containing protein [Roseateles aquatilis]OWQ90393.1 hypothetical protein CDN99_13650 [Roseateles aquatilis]
MKRNGFAAAIAAVVVGLAAYWYWSPVLAIHQMRSAAKSGDAAAFNDHVDYPRLRESLKEQLAAAVESKVAERSSPNNDLARAGAALGSLFAMAMTDRMVDAFVRPESVMRLMQEGQLMPRRKGDRQASPQEPDATPAPDDSASAQRREPIWTIERQGVDKLTLYARRADQPEERRTGLVFERRGFANWQLTEIRLPAL